MLFGGEASAVGLFAAVQIGREIYHANQRERSAAARVSAGAYRLRRRLKNWLGDRQEGSAFDSLAAQGDERGHAQR